jgi:hypothetical protein
LRRRGLADEDPALAEFFERYLPIDLAAAARRLEAEDAEYRRKADAAYPRLRPRLERAWANANKSAAGKYEAWGLDYRRALIEIVGHPEAAAGLGVVVAPRRAGWPPNGPAAGPPAGGDVIMSGIGASLMHVDGGVKIVGLMPGGPAAKSGRLVVGDVIQAIGQGEAPAEEIAGLALDHVMPKVRGPKGTRVRLRLRSGPTVSLVRDEISLVDADSCPPLPPARPREKGRRPFRANWFSALDARRRCPTERISPCCSTTACSATGPASSATIFFIWRLPRTTTRGSSRRRRAAGARGSCTPRFPGATRSTVWRGSPAPWA